MFKPNVIFFLKLLFPKMTYIMIQDRFYGHMKGFVMYKILARTAIHIQQSWRDTVPSLKRVKIYGLLKIMFPDPSMLPAEESYTGY